MFRVSLANAFAKRTLKPLHEKHQATPVSVLLDSAVTVVYSGQVAELQSDGTVKLFDGTGIPFGLFSLDKNTVIDDTDGQATDLGTGGNGASFAVWQGGPDAYFRVTESTVTADAPVQDTAWVVGGYVYVTDAGNLASTASGAYDDPIGQVTEVIATNDIVFRLDLSLPGNVEAAAAN